MKKQELIEQARIKAQQAREAAEYARKAKNNPQLVDMPEYTGDAEVDSRADMDAVKAGFRERAKTENERFRATTDSEYWFAVCFRDRAQKEAFLKAMDWIQYGDKYLPGDKLAKMQGIKLKKSAAKKTEPKIDKDFAGLAL